MTHHIRSLTRGDCLSPTDPSLLGNPLDFIHEDHLREREICAMLDRIATAERPNPDEVAEVLSFLQKELPLHLEDEEEDLFPLLRRRSEPEDDVDRAIARLCADHRHAETDTPEVIAVLAALENGHAPTAEGPMTLGVYAAHSRRHLILENAIILPLARLRLTRDDLESLKLRMLARRGLDRVMGAGAC